MSSGGAVIIASDPEDATGHIDGTVRFIDENKVFLAQWDGATPLFLLQKQALEKVKIEVIPIYCGAGKPSLFFEDECDATGCYLNYIELPDRLIVPTYGLKTDKAAIKCLAEATGKNVIPLDGTKIASGGGALRCISKMLPICAFKSE